MVKIPAGKLWIGSEGTRGPPDEHPRFLAHVGAYCLDRTEVTVAAYQACVEAEACKASRVGPVTCTATGDRRPEHPINCITWHQAVDYCAWKDKRLPTEVEWEYAARGGDERRYAWGDDDPDGRSCWKKPGACKVGSYPAEAYGLYDMTGNVWEWVADWYGPYPWPAAEGHHKIYRGGSWSRRFDKWMRVRLRNRWDPDKKGSHLGVRCASTPKATECPGGRTEDGSQCRPVVLDAECPPKESWNGIRCAGEGEPRCPVGTRAVEDHGCVRDLDRFPPAPGQARSAAKPKKPIEKTRSPRFDEDCQKFQPGRPHAYRLEGGTHAARNVAGKSEGCKNRDVGVGWNSVCCP